VGVRQITYEQEQRLNERFLEQARIITAYQIAKDNLELRRWKDQPWCPQSTAIQMADLISHNPSWQVY
jgi:hypothetical protein